MKQLIVLVLSLAFLLSACGGDGSARKVEKEVVEEQEENEEPETAKENEAQGVYRGLTDTGRDLLTMVRDDGEYYMLYYVSGKPVYDLSGVVIGTAGASEGNFSSTDANDLNFIDRTSTRLGIEADYKSGDYLTGIMENSDGGEGFTIAYDPDYDNTPDMAAFAGSYRGYYQGFLDSVVESSLVIVTIDADGTLTASSEIPSCMFTGQVAPRAAGNLFDVEVAFSETDCLLTGITLTGTAYHDSEAMFFAAPADDKQGGLFFSGNRLGAP